MCEHDNFGATVDVTHLVDKGAYVADIKVWCQECGERFLFPPFPSGIDCSEARVSVDGTQMTVPVRPASSAAFPFFPGFSVKPVALQSQEDDGERKA